MEINKILNQPTQLYIMIKKILIIVGLLLCFTNSFGQSKEKIKGSKIIKTSIIDVQLFETLELDAEDVEFLLLKSTKNAIEIEADDNLHDLVVTNFEERTLKIYVLKEISGAKKFTIKIHYTDALNKIVLRNKTSLLAVSDIATPKLTVECLQNSKLEANVSSKNFSLICNDNSKVKATIKCENATLKTNDSAKAEVNLSCFLSTIDVDDKSVLEIEGDTKNATLKILKNANFKGRLFTIGYADLFAENNSNVVILLAHKGTFSMADKAEVYVWGDPEIVLKQFSNNVSLYKKEK